MRALVALQVIVGALAFATPAAAIGSPWDTTFSGDGRVTTDFGANDAAADVVVQPDGKIVVIGTRGGDFGAFAVARYNTDGSLDTSFSGDGKAENSGGFATGSQAFAVALQPDGKIVVAGNVCGLLGCDFHLQRYNTDGSLDTGFNGNGTVGVSVGGLRGDTAYDVAIQPDGKIVAAGETCDEPYGEDCDVVLMRFQPNGSLDAGFAGGGIVVTHLDGGHFLAVGIQADGTIVAAGRVKTGPLTPDAILLARYGSGGALLDTHTARYNDNSTLSEWATALAIQPDGRIVVVGGDAFINFGVARFDSAGALDPTFSGDGKLTTGFGGFAFASGVAFQPDGRIVVVGLRDVARYTTSGDLDPSFHTDGRFSDASLSGNGVAIAEDGKIVVAGTIAGDFAVARLLKDGGDETAPVLTVPPAVVAEATSPAGAAVTYAATATDNVDPTPIVECTPASGSTFGLGITTVSCTATDDAGNSSERTFRVYVVDTIAPTIVAGSIRVNADAPAGALVNYIVRVRDAVDPSPTLVCQPPTGLFPVGVTTVTCTARDASGNEAVRSFIVTVVGFPGQGDDLVDEIGNLPLSGQADVRRDSAQQFCVNGFDRVGWASNGMPKTNDTGRDALLQIRQCVLYLDGPPAEVQTASASIRLRLIELVCRIAHIRYDEVRIAPGANASRLVQAKTSLDQADAAPGTRGALFDCVNAWVILRNEPPQYTS